MAGLYRRGVQRSAGLPLGQVQASKGVAGAPGGFAPKLKDEKNDASEKAQQIGGLLALLNSQKGGDASGFELPSGVPMVSEASSNDVLGGLALGNNGMSYEEVPTGFLNMLQNGWGSVMGMFGGGAGA